MVAVTPLLFSPDIVPCHESSPTSLKRLAGGKTSAGLSPYERDDIERQRGYFDNALLACESVGETLGFEDMLVASESGAAVNPVAGPARPSLPLP